VLLTVGERCEYPNGLRRMHPSAPHRHEAHAAATDEFPRACRLSAHEPTAAQTRPAGSSRGRPVSAMPTTETEFAALAERHRRELDKIKRDRRRLPALESLRDMPWLQPALFAAFGLSATL
jgi:hypothetical protein